MIQENYQKFLKKNKRDVVLKKFSVTQETISIDISCDGKMYNMECENKPAASGDWIPEGWPENVPFPKGVPDFCFVVYYNEEIIFFVIDSTPYCFMAKSYEPIKMKNAYLYDIIYVGEKTYILFNHDNPKLYEVKKFWERPSELFFIDKEGKLYWGHIIADDEQGYFRGSNIAYAIDGIGVDFVVEPVDELLEKLIAMKKEACI